MFDLVWFRASYLPATASTKTVASPNLPALSVSIIVGRRQKTPSILFNMTDYLFRVSLVQSEPVDVNCLLIV